jgi:hypothetical protein
MYTSKLTAMCATLVFASLLHGETTSIHGHSSAKNESLHIKEITVDKVDLPKINAKDYSAIKFSFKVWHKEKFDKDKYAKITKQFWDLAQVCQQSDKEKTGFSTIFDVIGEPFKNITSKIVTKDNFHGSVNINIENNSISLDALINREEKYDKNSWQSIVTSSINFFKNEQFIQKLSSIFTDVINAEDKSGIHGSLNISLEPVLKPVKV